jgi:SAM-dependent methyltransferase
MPERATQADLFLSGEGDNWFRRNQGALVPERVQGPDWALRLVREAGVVPRRALEVGASNGYRLECLRREFGCEAVGVEPSAEAVAEGARAFPGVTLRRGLSHDLGAFPDEHFDLVMLLVMLHWVDRRHLLRTAAEVDRVLAVGGHLLVSDFFPEQPHKVRYHHRPDVQAYTYKQDYTALWLATNLYSRAAEVMFDHATGEASEALDPAHRCRVTLLKKTGEANYPARERP